jgi:HlyD family secretion protein
MTTLAIPSPRARRARSSVLRWAAGAVAIVGLGLGLWAFLGRGTAPGSGEGPTSELAPVQKNPFDITTTATGELEARERIEIRSPLDQESTIVQIIPEGTWARKGDLLIQLNADTIAQKIDEEALRLRTETAELGTAQTQYNIQEKDNETNLRKAELKVTLAELALKQWLEGDDRKKRQELDLQISKATLELQRLAERYLRSQELYDEDFVSKDERDRDEVAYIEAISAYTTALLARDVYENYERVKEEKSKLSDLEEARSELERVKLNNANELANKQTRLESQRERVAIVERRLEKLRKDLAAATITAPSDGLVVYATSMERFMWGRGGDSGGLQIGQQVWPNQLLMILPNTNEMIAAVRVSESLAGKVRPGQPASVRVDAIGGKTFPGVVESIGVMAETGGWRDPNLREYTVRIALQGANGSLKPAMRCEARIVLEQVPETLSVPVQAVFSEGPVHFVYTPKGGKYARTPVKLGRRSDTRAEILAGLDQSSSVLIREPGAGEILAQPWNPDTLRSLGYRIADDGQPLPPEDTNAEQPARQDLDQQRPPQTGSSQGARPGATPRPDRGAQRSPGTGRPGGPGTRGRN